MLTTVMRRANGFSFPACESQRKQRYLPDSQGLRTSKCPWPDEMACGSAGAHAAYRQSSVSNCFPLMLQSQHSHSKSNRAEVMDLIGPVRPAMVARHSYSIMTRVLFAFFFSESTHTLDSLTFGFQKPCCTLIKTSQSRTFAREETSNVPQTEEKLGTGVKPLRIHADSLVYPPWIAHHND